MRQGGQDFPFIRLPPFIQRFLPYLAQFLEGLILGQDKKGKDSIPLPFDNLHRAAARTLLDQDFLVDPLFELRHMGDDSHQAVSSG